MTFSLQVDKSSPQYACIVGVCLLLAMALSACLPLPWTNSPKSDELTIYTNLDEEPFNTYIADFQSQHPDIQITALRRSTGELANRLIAEQDDPQADVVWGLSATVQNLLEWNDVLEPYAPAGLERVSPSFRDTSTPPTGSALGSRCRLSVSTQRCWRT